ncbi:MAG: peptide deformylase [Ruminococcaceae bacterium]|jgi:peptide deformylase|nr:peptide deformylase [Oscillospiraceae bacterium]
MALRTIMTQEQPTLHKAARPVTNFDQRLHDLLDDMAETLADANGAGLAAPQVGILRRIFLIDVDDRGLIEFINPEILETSGEQDGVEGCLSLPGQWGMVKRPNHVKIRAQDRDGAWFELEGDELAARCILHEYDHLEGHLYSEKVYKWLSEEEVSAMFEAAEEAEEAE